MSDHKKYGNKYQKPDNNIIKFNYVRSPTSISITDQNISAQSSRKYSRNRSYSLTKTQYVQANFKFILSPLIPPTEACLYNPDESVPWKYVICVILPISRQLTKSIYKKDDDVDVSNNNITNCIGNPEENLNEFLCPICLDQINLPKITSCGHSYCCTCILRHIDNDHKSSNKCPVCNEYICKTDLKTVLLASTYHYFQTSSTNHNQMFKVNDKIDFTLLEFTKGSLTPKLISTSGNKSKNINSNSMSHNTDIDNNILLKATTSTMHTNTSPFKKHLFSSSSSSSSLDKLNISDVIPSALSPCAPYCRLSYISIDMMREQFIKDKEALLHFRQLCLSMNHTNLNIHSSSVGDVEALPYIQQALELLATTETDFELKLVQHLEISEHIRVLERQQSYGYNLESNALLNSTINTSDNNTNNNDDDDDDDDNNNNSRTNPNQVPILNTCPNNQLLSKDSSTSLHLVQLNSNIIRDVEDSLVIGQHLNETTTSMKSILKSPSTSLNSNSNMNSNNINFPVYQFYTGELIFLHPLCMRCLYESILDYNNNETNIIEYSSNRYLPSILQSCRIVEIEYLRVTLSNRQRYHILRHIPLHCEVVFIEIDLNSFIPSLIQSHIYLKFKDEIDKRHYIRKEKKKQIKREKRFDIDRKIAEDSQIFDKIDYLEQIKLAEKLSIQELFTGPSLSINSTCNNIGITNQSCGSMESLELSSVTHRESQTIDNNNAINNNISNNYTTNNSYNDKSKNSFANITQMGGHYPTLADSIKSSKTSQNNKNNISNNNNNINNSINTSNNNNINTSSNKSSLSGLPPNNFSAWGKIIDNNKINNEFSQTILSSSNTTTSSSNNNITTNDNIDTTNNNVNETAKINLGFSSKKNKSKIVLMSNTR